MPRLRCSCWPSFIDLVFKTLPAIRDGAIYLMSMSVDGYTATVVGPDGVAVSHTDPRIGQLGRYLL